MNLARKFVVHTPLLAVMRSRSRLLGRILLYHRVVSDGSNACIGDLVGTAVTRGAFERQLDYLGKHYRVVDLDTMMNCLDRPDNMVAITFDDGYADNLLEAMPALVQRGMPATIFAVAGFIGTTKRAWWDRLARLIHENRSRQLRLDAGGTAPFSFTGNPKEQYRQGSRWCESLSDEQREAVFAGRFISDDDRFLDVSELRTLERNNIRIEAHTVTHRRMSTLDEMSAAEELTRGKAMLADMIGRPVTYFAYPFGLGGDFTDETQRLARQAGYSAAFAARSGLVNGACDRFALARLCACEDFDRFRIKVSRWRATP